MLLRMGRKQFSAKLASSKREKIWSIPSLGDMPPSKMLLRPRENPYNGERGECAEKS